MNRTAFIWGLVSTSVLGLAGQRQAAACGGCFHPPTQTVSDITDERMLLAVSTLQSTLYDQLEYSGSPTNFAWVLPIRGTVDVGLSADVLFDSFDVLTETQIIPPEPNCPSPNCFFAAAAVGSVASSGTTSSASAEPVVTVTKQENVGPYATVQLHSTDSGALEAWLAQNGYNITPDVAPVIAEYITEGFDFLAMKLLPNQGVQAMRPVRVTTPGASLSLPLRMAAVGTGPEVGITIWVVADGRYEPQNFPFFHIDDSALVWDFSTSQSNYTTLRVQNEANLMGKGWEIESSISLNEQTISNVILSGGQYYGGGGFGGAVAAPADPTLDYLPVPASGDGGAEGGAGQTAEEVRTADVNDLFAGLTGPNVRVTRIRSDILHTAMTADFVLEASSDQSELSNVRNVTQSVNLTCPIYNGCAQVGLGTPAQAAASIAATSGSPGASGAISASGSFASGSLASGSVALDAGASESVSGTSGSFGGSAGPAGGVTPSATQSGGGCVASAQTSRGSAATLGAMAGMLGLVGVRTVRSRRHRARKA
jgi:uncharacterized protein DUF2330